MALLSADDLIRDVIRRNEQAVILTSSGGKKGGLTPLQSFIAGGVAGVVSRTFTSPLDVIKILFQVQRTPVKAKPGEVVAKPAYTGFWSAFGQIYREEGLKGFWKGNMVACVRLFPYSALKFFIWTWMKAHLGDEKGNFSTAGGLMWGAASGVAATVVVYPLDLVKTRLTIQKEGGEKYYKGITHCLMRIAQEEGILALYNGVTTSVIGAVPFEGGTFMAYEVLRKLYGGASDKDLPPGVNFLNGCLSAAFAQTFSYPFDLVRKRLQAQAKVKGGFQEHRYNGMMDCFQKVVKEEGVMALYKGTAANLAKVVPYAGISFMSWEFTKKMFKYYNTMKAAPIPVKK